MNKISFLFFFISLTGLNAFAANMNCLDKNADKYLCTQVVDLSKLIYIDCLGDLGDGFEENLCSNITIPAEDGTDVIFDCLKDGKNTNDPYIIDRCSKLPNPSSVTKVNCMEELEDGYQVNLCKSVDSVEQESVLKKLSQQK